MIIKRPVYNKDMKCVAMELIVNQAQDSEKAIQMLMNTISQGVENSYPLFVPYAVKEALENCNLELENPIIYKLHANDIDTTYTRSEIEASPYSIALLIDTVKQLAWLNFADYIALSECLMHENDVSKVVQFSQAKQRKVIAYGLLQPYSFDKCAQMTMDYYCGDFVMKPQEKNSVDMAANKINVLQLISKIQNSDVKFMEISDLITTDPILSYQLLRVANSAAFSGVETIEAIDQALVRLGLENLKNWVMLLSMKNISNKPIEVVESGLVRAKMAEKLSQGDHTICAPNMAYTAGLLSILDALMDYPMEALLERITIADEIRDALLSHSGQLGSLLQAVISYESACWDDMESDHFNGLNISEVYLSCLEEVAQSKEAMTQNLANA